MHPSSALIGLLTESFSRVNPNVETALNATSAHEFVKVVIAESLSVEVRVAACIALKNYAIAHPGPCSDNSLFEQLCEICCFNNETDSALIRVQSVLEGVIEQMLTLNFEDEIKLKLFEAWCEQLDVSEMRPRRVRLLQMLIKSMHETTLDNEICVGAIICILKERYDSHEIETACVHCLLSHTLRSPLLETCAALLSLLEEILFITNDIENGLRVPHQYLEDSSYFQKTLEGILLTPSRASFLNSNSCLNSLTLNSLSLLLMMFPLTISNHVFQMALKTAASWNIFEIQDENEEILIKVLLILEGGVERIEYLNCFHKVISVLGLRLAQLLCSRQAECSLMSLDVDYFVDIQEKLCKGEKDDGVKLTAASLLSVLCLYIDGFLSFVVELCFHVLDCVECGNLQQLNKIEGNQNLFQQPEQLWESCIQMLTCLSDQVERRPEAYLRINKHLSFISTALSKGAEMGSLLLCRYFYLATYYATEGCMNCFLSYFCQSAVYTQSLLSCERILAKAFPHNSSMHQYIILFSESLLLQLDHLCSFVEEIIVKENSILYRQKNTLLEKLVVWFLEAHSKKELLQCNKYSNLIVQLLSKAFKKHTEINPTGKTETIMDEETVISIETSAMISAYLQPIYNIAFASTEVDNCIVEVAGEHTSLLHNCLDFKTTSFFFQLAFTVAFRHDKSLILVFELVNALLCSRKSGEENEQTYLIRKQVAKWLLPKLGEWLCETDARLEEQWANALLTEIAIVVLGDSTHIPLTNLVFLSALCQTTHCETLHLRLYVTLWCSLSCAESVIESHSLLLTLVFPENLPPWEKMRCTIYLMRCLPRFNEKRLLLFIKIMDLMESTVDFEKECERYRTDTLCKRFTNIAIDDVAMQLENVTHPISFKRLNVYNEFRKIPCADLIPLLSSENQLRFRILYKTILVGHTSRIIHQVKRTAPFLS